VKIVVMLAAGLAAVSRYTTIFTTVRGTGSTG
jgi:hypothetical protein